MKLPTIIPLKRRLLQIEGEQKAHKANKIIKPFSNAVQHGIIKQTPRKVDARVKKYDNAGRMYYDGYFNDIYLNVGDKVYFHHFVSQPENEIEVDGELLYKADYNQIICVVRGEKIVPLEKWLLATPVMEEEKDTFIEVADTKIYTKLSPEKKFMRSKVEYVGAQAQLSRFSRNQIILHPTFSEYKLKIEGVDMYRMHIDDIFCIIEED
jgi:co-chaperonin GroES (HSP10)